MSDCSTYPFEKINRLEERIKELEVERERLYEWVGILLKKIAKLS